MKCCHTRIKVAGVSQKGDVKYSKRHCPNKNVKKYIKHIAKGDKGDTKITNRDTIIYKDNI